MRNIYKEKADIQSKQQMVRYLKKHTYNSLDIAQRESYYPETLNEIEFRQSKYGHLTIIDDFMLDIFHEFDNLASSYLNATMLCVKWNNLFRYIFETAFEALSVERSSVETQLECVKPALVIYLKVCLKELGAQIQSELQVKRN